MRLAPLTAAAMLLIAPVLQATDAGDATAARAVVASARQRIEATDSRATGHLVRVDAGGNRTSHAFAIKAHWFPGVLRVSLEIVPSRTTAEEAHDGVPRKARQGARGNMREDRRVRVLFEMRPEGPNTIQIFHPHDAAPVTLPFDQWNQSVVGSDFSYEDFLQAEVYWHGQTLLKSARVGAHDCDVLKSTPTASERSHYVQVQTWIDRTNSYPVYVEKTLREAAAVKEFTSFGLRQSGGVWSARQVEVKVHGRPGSTLLIFERGSTKANLTSKDFSPEQISTFEDHP